MRTTNTSSTVRNGARLDCCIRGGWRARRVRFVLITGTNDFRRGNILDIYNGGFARQHFAAKLIDVPGLDHAICDAATLSAALDFLEGKT